MLLGAAAAVARSSDYTLTYAGKDKRSTSSSTRLSLSRPPARLGASAGGCAVAVVAVWVLGNVDVQHSLAASVGAEQQDAWKGSGEQDLVDLAERKC